MINIKLLKENLTLEDFETIFEALEIPITNKSSKYWKLKSGCHNIDVNDGDSNLIFYLESKTFQCYSHGCINGGDIIELVLIRKRLLNEDIKFIDAVNFIIDNSNISIDKINKKITNNKTKFNMAQFINKYRNQDNGIVELDIYNEKNLELFDNLYPVEWLEDNISIESMDKFEIKYYNRLNQIILPVRDELGNLVGIRSRNMKPELIDKAKYIPTKILNGEEFNFPSSAILYGLYQNIEEISKSKCVFIFESEKSVLQMNTYNIKNCVAMFGLNISKYQANLLLTLGVECVIICIDKDYYNLEEEQFDDYVKKVKKIAQRFKGFCKVEVIYDKTNLLEYKDSPSDRGKNVFDILYKERELIE